jgi:hypothetical protein
MIRLWTPELQNEMDISLELASIDDESYFSLVKGSEQSTEKFVECTYSLPISGTNTLEMEWENLEDHPKQQLWLLSMDEYLKKIWECLRENEVCHQNIDLRTVRIHPHYRVPYLIDFSQAKLFSDLRLTTVSETNFTSLPFEKFLLSTKWTEGASASERLLTASQKSFDQLWATYELSLGPWFKRHWSHVLSEQKRKWFAFCRPTFSFAPTTMASWDEWSWNYMCLFLLKDKQHDPHWKTIIDEKIRVVNSLPFERTLNVDRIYKC